MTTSEIIWDLADFDLYLEYNEWYKTIAFYEFPKLLEEYETVEEIINFIKRQSTNEIKKFRACGKKH